MRKKNYTKKEIKERERKMNEIFDRTTEQIKKIERLKKFYEYLEMRRKRTNLIFDLGMALLLIVNILLFVWTKGYFQMWNIGFVFGMWLANFLHRGIMRR